MAAKKKAQKKAHPPKQSSAIIELRARSTFIKISNAFPKAKRDQGAMAYLKGLDPSCRIEEPDDTTIILHFKDAKTARKAFGRWFTSEQEPVLGLAIPWDHNFIDQQAMAALAGKIVKSGLAS